MVNIRRGVIMAHIAMTSDAAQLLRRNVEVHLGDGGRVTLHTIFLGNARIKAADHDRFGKIARREGDAVVPTIDALDHPFVGKAMGRVTVVARGDRFVAGMAPPFVLLAHNVAVDTRRRIV